MSAIPYFLRNPLLDQEQEQPPTMAPPVQMAPPSPVIQHPMHAMIAPIGPPAMDPMDIAQTMAAPKPQVSLDPNVNHQKEATLEAGMAKKPEGFGQKLGHGLGMAGRIAGDIVAPAETELVTRSLGKMGVGPEANEYRQKQLTSLQNQDMAQESEKSKEGLEGATTAHLNAETPEVAPNAETTRALQGAETDQKKAEIDMGPSLATAYAHRVNEVLKQNGDPSQDPIVQHLQDAITGLQKQTASPPGTKTVQLEIGGKPHQVLVDERTGETVKDLGPSGEKPPTVNVNEGHKEELAQKQQVFKTYQPVMDSAERFNVMGKNYEDAIKNHDQQAMLSLLYNHMGMIMGLQKGARMTKDLIHEAQQSQPWLQGIQAKFDKDGYLTGVTLSPRQMQEMVNNAQGRYQEDVVKARNEAKYLGAQDDGPERTPSAPVINFYIAKANGDPTKAKQLASQDGWSIH